MGWTDMGRMSDELGGVYVEESGFPRAHRDAPFAELDALIDDCEQGARWPKDAWDGGNMHVLPSLRCANCSSEVLVIT